jgi:hypothetical protein
VTNKPLANAEGNGGHPVHFPWSPGQESTQERAFSERRSFEELPAGSTLPDELRSLSDIDDWQNSWPSRWPHGLGEEEILERLLAENLRRGGVK